jgi:Holliday junction resolvase RusA-like endonuclease
MSLVQVAISRGDGLEPDFPIEFIVYGTPVSHQRENAHAREEWKELVRSACMPCLPEMHFATDRPLAVTLFYYPEDRMVGDLDNIVKLTLDAMSEHVYLDDEQIERIVVQKFERERVFPFSDPSETLAACMLGLKPALYIRLSDDPHEELRA